MAVPLYQCTIISDHPQEYFFEKFISPHVWEGELYIDGGWGPKNEILEITSDDPITGFKIPFYLSPSCHIDEITRKESDKKYLLSFPGEQWKLLVMFIEEVKKLGVTEQRYVLNSYFNSQLPEEGKEIYQIHIVVNETTTINIEKGKWIPSFDDSILVAGW